LGQIDVEVSNEGSEFIEQPGLNLILPAETRILGAHTDPEDANAQCLTDKNILSVRLPHLNPVHEHQQLVTVSVLVDGPTAPLKITGGGQGWSIRYHCLPTMKQQFWSNIGRIALYLASMFMMLLYLRWVDKKFGIDPWELSWRSFYTGAPGLISLLPVLVLEIWDKRKRSKRPLGGWADY